MEDQEVHPPEGAVQEEAAVGVAGLEVVQDLLHHIRLLHTQDLRHHTHTVRHLLHIHILVHRLLRLIHTIHHRHLMDGM